MKYQEEVRLFTTWYVEPIKLLETLPNGAGGWVAFMIGLALYERLIIAQLKIKGDPMDNLSRNRAMSTDLEITEHQRSIFWDLCRNGLLHQAMPKKGATGLYLHDSFSDKPKFEIIDGVEFVCINPWKFTMRVLNTFLSKPELIDASDSYPLATII